MYYRLSILADRRRLETTFKAGFVYPNIYEPLERVEGLGESHLPLIRQGHPELIEPAIWGLMPSGYKQEWATFQKQMNTLNLRQSDFVETDWLEHLLERQRGVVLATGFYTHHIFNGSLLPYHVHLPQLKPFPLAAVYTQLDDGFLTCAILTTPISKKLAWAQDLGRRMPMALSHKQLDLWISEGTSKSQIEDMFRDAPLLPFKLTPMNRLLSQGPVLSGSGEALARDMSQRPSEIH